MAAIGGTASRVAETDRRGLGTLWRSRLMPSARPDKLIGTLARLHRWGLAPAGTYNVGAIRCPYRTAIIDDHGPLTFGDVHRRTNVLARAFRASGVGERDAVAIMCRNHRGFIEATVACSKLGANVLYLDASLTTPRIAELIRRADPVAIVHDEEFTALIPDRPSGCTRFLAREETSGCLPPFENLLAGGEDDDLAPPRCGRFSAILATDSAEHPQRTVPGSLLWTAPLRTRIPLRRGETTILAAPLSQPWGFLHLRLGLRLASTLVLRRRIDPARILQDVREHRAKALVVTPQTLSEIMALGTGVLADRRDGSLEVIAVSGRTLPEEVALPAIQAFGEVLYNLSGPTMVKLGRHWVTVEDELSARHVRRRRSSAILSGGRPRRRHA
jgi:fatty-acyl-CoA synthase